MWEGLSGFLSRFEILSMVPPICCLHWDFLYPFVQDANPWFRVHLVRNVYIYSVHVFSACCPTSNKTRLNVSIGANGSVTGHCSAGTQEGFFADRGMHVYYCQPPPVGRYITVHATGGSSFCLCETNVYGIGECDNLPKRLLTLKTHFIWKTPQIPHQTAARQCDSLVSELVGRYQNLLY